MKYLYDKNGVYIDSVPRGSDEDIRIQFPECTYILENFIGEKAIVENNSIRMYTRLDRIKEGTEILQEGEYIKDNEIISVEKPNNFHLWDSKKKKWVYDKELEKSIINEEILNKETELNNLYDTLDKATARKLKALIADTQSKIDKIIEELETLETKLKNLEG